jgi:hypothetical protein
MIDLRYAVPESEPDAPGVVQYRYSHYVPGQENKVFSKWMYLCDAAAIPRIVVPDEELR